jgi:hypothetical protein
MIAERKGESIAAPWTSSYAADSEKAELPIAVASISRDDLGLIATMAQVLVGRKGRLPKIRRLWPGATRVSPSRCGDAVLHVVG